LLLAIVVLAGCGRVEEQAAAPETEYTIEVVSSFDEAELTGPLPEGACFVGAFDYDVQVLVDSPEADAVCTEIAERYLAGEERLAWPPPDLLDPDRVNECVLERGDGVLAVSPNQDNDETYELATEICEDYEARGWTSWADGYPGEETEADDSVVSDG
jgi:hypothetical protein